MDAVGPIFAAGFQHITNSGYEILYLPDLHNTELQQEGKAPVYWWLPNTVRLARQNGDTGDYKFSFINFNGVPSGGTAGATNNVVQGGLLSFSTTAAPPASVLQESQNALLNIFRGNDDKYWGWRTPVAPMFRPAPIVSNTCTITNLSPNPDGSVPVASGSKNAPPDPSKNGAPSANGSLRTLRAASTPPLFQCPRSVPVNYRNSNLDMWYANLQGQGNGSVSPFAENAYSGLVGSIPAALIWTSFHSGSGGISVWQKMKIKVWSPVVHLLIEGDWDRIQEHFSAAGHAGGLFWSADIQAQFNNLRVNGGITVTVEVDTTLPNADKLQEQLDKRTDLVFQKFMDQAQKMIFDPAPFTEKPAEASGGFLGFGGGAAFKLRVDQTHAHLRYKEDREIAYLQDYPISGQLEGLYAEIKANPAAEKKYFTNLYLNDWDRMVTRTVKPVVNWPNPSQKWAGEPVAFLSAQIGYPNTEGALEWDGHIFQSTDPPDAVWSPATPMKNAADVSNAPAGWKPDMTFVKRQIHFTEPPNDNEDPFVRIAVEKNIVDLDAGDQGAPTDLVNLEVRVDNVGVLSVGPMFLNVDLGDAKQIVEVTFQAQGNRDDGQPRPPVRFSWQFSDQTTPRYWMIFTGQPAFIPKFQYQVHVIVKGSIFTKGMEWTGPWVDASANGPLMVSVPTPTDPGVQAKDYVPGTVAAATDGPPAMPAPAGAPAAAAQPDGGPPAQPAPAPSKTGVPVTAGRDISGWTTTPSDAGASRDYGDAGPPPMKKPMQEAALTS
jgi:hypothetical protein